MSKGGYKIIDQGGMQCKRLLLGNEMWAAKNRTFDIDLLLVGPELQTQDSATLRLEATKDSWVINGNDSRLDWLSEQPRCMTGRYF